LAFVMAVTAMFFQDFHRTVGRRGDSAIGTTTEGNVG
jgi:hypothetical protein